MRRALIIGLDGATFDLIKPWAASGQLPTFARLLREGSHGLLRTVQPPLTAPAWSTMVTGMNPGKHGLVDFWARDLPGYHFRLLNASSRAGPCLWDVVGQAGGRVIVCNVPMTYPPTPVNGVLVSGMDTPGMDAPYTYPAELKHELNKVVGRYVIVPDDWLYSRRRQYDRARAELLHGMQVHFAAGMHLLQRYPWDLAMLVLTATDGAAHFFWKFMDPQHPLYDARQAALYGDTILRVYQSADAKLAALLESLPADTVLFVVSDHGNGRTGERVIYLNAWLEQQGLLHYRQGSALERGRRAVSQGTLGLLRSVRRLMRSWIPYELQLQIEALFPGGGKRIESGLQSAQIDWSRTKAFSEEVRGSVWINLQGRDAQGIVAPGAEYEGLRDQIIAAAADLRDPRTGEALIERAYRREELYHGPHANLEPDVVLEARDTVQIFRKRESLRATTPVHVLSRAEMSRADTSGHHLMNAILMMYGPGVEAGRKIADAQMQDVAPTVLYAMGLPAPSHMDGQVLRAAFEPSHLAQHPVQTGAEHAQGASDRDEAGSAYSEDEARLVEDRLRGLGYL